MSEDSSIELLSFIVADDVRREIGGKLTIVGMYLDAELDYIPEDEQKQLYIIAAIRGLPSGEHPFHLEIRDLKAERQVKLDENVCISAGDKSIVLVIMKLQDFFFPNAGAYQFRLFLGDKRIVNYPVMIKFESSANSTDAAPIPKDAAASTKSVEAGDKRRSIVSEKKLRSPKQKK